MNIFKEIEFEINYLKASLAAPKSFDEAKANYVPAQPRIYTSEEKEIMEKARKSSNNNNAENSDNNNNAENNAENTSKKSNAKNNKNTDKKSVELGKLVTAINKITEKNEAAQITEAPATDDTKDSNDVNIDLIASMVNELVKNIDVKKIAELIENADGVNELNAIHDIVKLFLVQKSEADKPAVNEPEVKEPIEEPKVEEPTVNETKVTTVEGEPKVEEPKIVPVKEPVEEPIVDVPVEEPIVDVPVEEPIVDVPVEEPIVDVPVEAKEVITEEPKVEEPTVNETTVTTVEEEEPEVEEEYSELAIEMLTKLSEYINTLKLSSVQAFVSSDAGRNLLGWVNTAMHSQLSIKEQYMICSMALKELIATSPADVDNVMSTMASAFNVVMNHTPNDNTFFFGEGKERMNIVCSTTKENNVIAAYTKGNIILPESLLPKVDLKDIAIPFFQLFLGFINTDDIVRVTLPDLSAIEKFGNDIDKMYVNQEFKRPEGISNRMEQGEVISLMQASRDQMAYEQSLVTEMYHPAKSVQEVIQKAKTKEPAGVQEVKAEEIQDVEFHDVAQEQSSTTNSSSSKKKEYTPSKKKQRNRKKMKANNTKKEEVAIE